MANERKTEILFREFLQKNGYYSNNKITVEEQSSDNAKIDKLLKNASKKGNGKGYPEFIITHADFPNLIIVVECKSSNLKHVSETKKDYSNYAVDGVLLYGSFLSKEYDVIAIGVSGESLKEIKISSYFYPHTSDKFFELKYLNSEKTINEVIPFVDYEKILNFRPEKELIELEKVLDFSGRLHNYMRDYVGLTEQNKPLLVSAIMLSLQDKIFKKMYLNYEKDKNYSLVEKMIESVKNILTSSDIPKTKVQNLIHTFSFIQSNEALKKINSTRKNSHLACIIEDIDNTITPFMEKYSHHDIIGKFYGEFISYTGGDGKGLGIVLTPKHITDFMAKIIDVNMDSVVLDTCTGTGAFLITAMNIMKEDARNNLSNQELLEKEEVINKNQLIGVEYQSNMYAMACANMIFRGDGKSNIINGSCFDFGKEIKILKPNKALINPPYAQKGKDLKEIDFIKFTLDCLEKEGKMACIVPMSVAIDTKNAHVLKKKQLLDSHRLDAVLSMPNTLFEPFASTCTCIMVFTAHIPHNKDPYHETFFGYYKEDGFQVTRNGRKDFGSWNVLEQKWIETIKKGKEIEGFSVKKKVSEKDEWCSEAYITTKYSLSNEDFINTLKEYVAFKLINDKIKVEKDANGDEQKKSIEINLSRDGIVALPEITKWKNYKISDFFSIESGGDKPKENDLEKENWVNSVENLTTNNGIKEVISYNGKTFKNFISVVSIGIGGTSFYQEDSAALFTRVKGLIPKKDFKKFNKYVALFFVVILNQEKYKYSYGRVVTKDKINNTIIKLPINDNKEPDWDLIEKYIKSLPYSNAI